MKRPSVEQVNEYMIERGFFEFDSVNREDQAESFFDHHESGGWKVGKKPMVKWEAAVRTWIRHAKKWSKPNETSNGHKQSFADRQREQAQRAMQAMESGNGSVNTGNIRAIR